MTRDRVATSSIGQQRSYRRMGGVRSLVICPQDHYSKPTYGDTTAVVVNGANGAVGVLDPCLSPGPLLYTMMILQELKVLSSADPKRPNAMKCEDVITINFRHFLRRCRQIPFCVGARDSTSPQILPKPIYSETVGFASDYGR